LGKWQQTEMATSHEWQERSKKWQEISKKMQPVYLTGATITLHEELFGHCADDLLTAFYEIGVKTNVWKDPALHGRPMEVLLMAPGQRQK